MSDHFLYHTSDIGVKFFTQKEFGDNFIAWFSDREVCQFSLRDIFPFSLRACESFLNTHSSMNDAMAFSVYHLEDDVHLGNIYLHDIQWIHRSAKVYFFFGEKSYWSQGFAETAACLIMRHAFEVLNLHRLSCSVVDTNDAMKRLADKLGFDEEGRRVQALFLNGEYVDVIEYGLLAADWQPSLFSE